MNLLSFIVSIPLIASSVFAAMWIIKEVYGDGVCVAIGCASIAAGMSYLQMGVV